MWIQDNATFYVIYVILLVVVLFRNFLQRLSLNSFLVRKIMMEKMLKV